MKELICKAFCDSVSVSELPRGAGFGISSSLFEVHGDQAGAYVVGPDKSGHWRMDDSGWVTPMLIASGYDLGLPSRLQTFEDLLARGGLSYDRDTLEIFVPALLEQDIPATAIRFISTLSRVADLATWTEDRIRSTFREDVETALHELLPEVKILHNAPADPRIPDVTADLVLKSMRGPSVALFLAQSDVPLLEAMLLRSETSGLPERPRVAAIMEREKSASAKTRTRAQNRLDVVTVYEGDAQAAIKRLAEEVLPRVN